MVKWLYCWSPWRGKKYELSFRFLENLLDFCNRYFFFLGWGVICGDSWTILEATVVCRMLGLNFASYAAQSNFFGGNSSAILMSGIRCRGDEINLHQCTVETAGSSECLGREDRIAGVICSSSKTFNLFLLPALIVMRGYVFIRLSRSSTKSVNKGVTIFFGRFLWNQSYKIRFILQMIKSDKFNIEHKRLASSLIT